MTDEKIQDATLTEEPMTSETTTDVEDVIEAEATEDTGDFDEPQAGEVASAEVDTVDEGEDEIAEAVEEAIDAADTDSLEEGLSGTAEADIAAEDAALAAEESQADVEAEPADEADARRCIGTEVVRGPATTSRRSRLPAFRARRRCPWSRPRAPPSSGT